MSKSFFTKLIREYKPNIASTSLSQYVTLACSLFPDVNSEKELEISLSKESLEKIVTKIQENYSSSATRSLRYNTLIVVLKGLYGSKDDRFIRISHIRDKCNDSYQKKASEPNLSHADDARMVTTEEYDKMLDDWYPKIYDLMNREKVTHTQFSQIEIYHALLIYLEYAIRADLSPCDVKFQTEIPSDTTKN